jgi:hypothetical protein
MTSETLKNCTFGELEPNVSKRTLHKNHRNGTGTRSTSCCSSPFPRVTAAAPGWSPNGATPVPRAAM